MEVESNAQLNPRQNPLPRIYLLAVREELFEAFRESFHDVKEAFPVRMDFEAFIAAYPDVQGIVSPANSFGMMTGGLDKALRNHFGKSLQAAVRQKILTEWVGEQPVGTSMSVAIPGFPGKILFHTPTMRTPSPILDYEVVYHCMRSALIEALKCGCKSLMVPAFGGETGRVPEKIIAGNMKTAYDQVRDQLPSPHVATFRSARSVIRKKPE